MNPTLEYWPLVTIFGLLAAGIGALFLLRRQVNRESGDDEARIERALLTARKAAAGLSRDRRPRRWVRAQMQVAMLLTQGGGWADGLDRLREALEILTAAIPLLEEKRLTGEWATALYYRGRAEWGIGMTEANGAGLETAVATFRDLLLLKPWPRHLLRSVIMTLPAVILADLGQRRGNRAMIEDGMALCREAVTIARRRITVEWCIAHRNLCYVLTILGRRTDDADLLEEAVVAGHEAATTIRRTRDPHQWIHSQIYLGHALCALGELSGDADRLQEGVTVLEEIRRTNDSKIERESRILVSQPLGGALMAIGRLTGNRLALRRALQELIAASKSFNLLKRDFAQAETERMMGLALASLSAVEKDSAMRREAESHYRAALEIFNAAGATKQTEETETALHDLENAADKLPAANFTPLYTVR